MGKLVPNDAHPFVRRWLEVIEGRSVEAIAEFLESIHDDINVFSPMARYILHKGS